MLKRFSMPLGPACRVCRPINISERENKASIELAQTNRRLKHRPLPQLCQEQHIQRPYWRLNYVQLATRQSESRSRRSYNESRELIQVLESVLMEGKCFLASGVSRPGLFATTKSYRHAS